MAHSVEAWERDAEALSYHGVGYIQAAPDDGGRRPADRPLVGRLAGGLFVYAISIVDAYQWAVHRQRASAAAAGSG